MYKKIRAKNKRIRRRIRQHATFFGICWTALDVLHDETDDAFDALRRMTKEEYWELEKRAIQKTYEEYRKYFYKSQMTYNTGKIKSYYKKFHAKHRRRHNKKACRYYEDDRVFEREISRVYSHTVGIFWDIH